MWIFTNPSMDSRLRGNDVIASRHPVAIAHAVQFICETNVYI